jgi:transposase-like protein
MGVEGISRGQVSRITSSINEFVETFRKRPLKDVNFPVLFIDAIFEGGRFKLCLDLKHQSGHREYHGSKFTIADEGYHETNPRRSQQGLSKVSVSLNTFRHVPVSDGAAGLTTAMAEVLPGAKWQHCKVHLIRKILRNVRVEDRQTIADELKKIWYTSHKSKALRRANKIYNKYLEKYPAAMTSIRLAGGGYRPAVVAALPEIAHC